MKSFRRILVAVDASDDADRVLEGATSLVPRGDEEFHVVTVVPPVLDSVSGMGGAAFSASWPLKDMEDTIAREVRGNVCERVARFGIPPERVSVLHGRPATEIHAEADRVGADLIVVGSHGRNALSRVMLGSTANGVLHGSPCDVLTVRIRD